MRTSSDYELEICSPEVYNNLIVPEMRAYFPKGFCLKHQDKVSFRGNFALAQNANPYLGVFACNPKKRKTCKSRKEIGQFLSYSPLFILTQDNIVKPDQFDSSVEESGYFKGDLGSYFPVGYNMYTILWDRIPVTFEKSDWTPGSNNFFSLN